MPTKVKRRAPKATKKKVWVHTFYLLQPIVQFMALAAVMLFLARCSPLAPSTDRTGVKGTPEMQDPSTIVQLSTLEIDLTKNLQELNSAKAEVLSQSDMDKEMADAPLVDEKISESQIKNLFEKKRNGSRKHRRVLLLPLSAEAQAALFQDGVVRVDLADRLSIQNKEESVKLMLEHLHAAMEDKDLGAAAYLVLSDSSMRRIGKSLDGLNLTLKISLSVLAGSELAMLEIRLVDTGVDNASLLEAARVDSPDLAIVLE